MNSTDSGTLELRVGLFVLIGLFVVGAMVIQFGRFGQSLEPRYGLTLEFPNASGLLKNSKVLLAGARIGIVSTAPRVVRHGRAISVEVKILDSVRIPKNATFVIGSSGLLGDRFVDVLVPTEASAETFAAGETVKGSHPAGMEELTREGTQMLSDARLTLANLNGAITKVQEGLLQPATFAKLQASLANLEAATKGFRESSDKLGPLVTDARGAVTDVRAAIGGGKQTLDSARAAAEDLRAAIDDTRKVLASTKRAVDEVTTGHGPVATLLTDRALSDNLSALIANLRRSGVLFYKDRQPQPGSEAPAPTPPASKRR